VSNMLAWPLIGSPPATLTGIQPRVARRGPVPSGPTLSSADQPRFFEHLRLTAERLRFRDSASASHDHRALFTHQAYYRLGWNRTQQSTRWLQQTFQVHSSHPEWATRWTEEWLAVRALACSPDPPSQRHEPVCRAEHPLHPCIADASGHSAFHRARCRTTNRTPSGK
jgi:hypothetical protein